MFGSAGSGSCDQGERLSHQPAQQARKVLVRAAGRFETWLVLVRRQGFAVAY
jgi:hypothetical protein